MAKIKAEAEELAAKLNELTVTIVAKASDSGKIFGSITSIQVAEAIEKAGLTVDRKAISVKNAVKELGSFKAQIKLHKEVSAEVTVEVVAE